jgi:hypothetical protein
MGLEYIRNKYLSWRFKKETEKYHKWFQENVVTNASTIENMFMNFQYIIPLSNRVLEDTPFGWTVCEDLEKFMYPHRTIDNCCVSFLARGYRDRWDGRFHLNDLRHEEDVLFVATNNREDAVMMVLKWS